MHPCPVAELEPAASERTGQRKGRAIVTLYAFTNNVLQGLRLQQQHFLAANRSQERSLVTA